MKNDPVVPLSSLAMQNILEKLIVTLLMTAGSGVYVAEDSSLFYLLFPGGQRSTEVRWQNAHLRTMEWGSSTLRVGFVS